MQVNSKLAGAIHGAISFPQAQTKAQQAEKITWAEEYTRSVVPFVTMGECTPTARKRKAVEELQQAATAVKVARRQFCYADVEEDETRWDEASSADEVAAREPDTRNKRRKLCKC